MARHGENIRKRKDGRWEGRYIKGRDRTGKAVQGYVYAPTYAEVKEKLIRCKAEASFYMLKGDDPTFEEVANAWIGSMKPGIKESTFAHYRYTLTRYVLPVLGKYRMKRLNESILEQGLLQMISPSDKRHKPLGRSSARECVTMVKRICKYANHLRLLRPMQVEVMLPKASAAQVKPLSSEEQSRAAAYVLQDVTPRKLGLLLAMQMGLRIGEICGLQWGDFDLEAGTLTIHRTVQRISCGDGHTKILIQRPKTSSSARQLPIPGSLLGVLRRLRGRLRDAVWFLSGNAEKPVEPRCYRKSLHLYLRAAATRSVHPHALRHTFATTCLQKGCDVKTLSEMLGHASADITLKRYVHTDLERMRSEMERVYGRRRIAC